MKKNLYPLRNFRILTAFILALLLLPFVSFSQSKKTPKSESTTTSKSKKPAKEEVTPTAKTTDKVDRTALDKETLSLLILGRMNDYRKANKMDELHTNDVLSNAAMDQATYMAKKELVTPKGNKGTVGGRVQSYGGSRKAEEILVSVSISKGREGLSYDDIAKSIVDKWISNKKNAPIMLNGEYVFTGIGLKLDKEGKKLYVSEVFGGYNIVNTGKGKKKQLPVPFTTSKNGLKAFDPKECRACEKFRDMDKLQEGLAVENGKIMFRTNDLRALKKLLRKPGDGIAVDIIQRAQYPDCEEYNIMDNNLNSKGIFTKKIMRNKLLSSNTKKKQPRLNKLEVVVAKLPKKLQEPYEMNLVIIQNKTICRSITPKKVDALKVNASMVELLPDTFWCGTEKYSPAGESNTLSFTIPFKQGKADYSTADIEPFFKSLDEPDFVVDGVYITGYSSIEGDSLSNAALQRRRANSIADAMEKLQKKNIDKVVSTNDSWDTFKKQVKGTKWEYLASKPKWEAQQLVNNGLVNELEPILAKERFSLIVLDVVYDMSGDHEQKFVVRSLQKALKSQDPIQAQMVLNFASLQVLSGKYDAKPFLDFVFPKEAPFAPLRMTQIWLRNKVNKEGLTDELSKELSDLNALAPTDPYIQYNKVFCEMNSQDVKVKEKDIIQAKIDALYTTKMPKATVDGLNLEFQFRIMDAVDTTDVPGPLVNQCIEKIKTIYNVKEATWQNALKLAMIFHRMGDNRYALTLLDPLVDKKDVDQDVLFTYIALCSYFKDRINSQKFVSSLEKANEANPTRYCDLFGKSGLTFQVFDNPFVKQDFCKSCRK